MKSRTRFALCLIGRIGLIGLIGLIAVVGCRSSSEPAPAPAVAATASPIAIVGYGVQLVPSPLTSAAILPNGALIFGPRADAPRHGKIKNALAKPGKPPTGALTPHPEDNLTIFSDGAADTTTVATGAGMTNFDGVLTSVSVSPRTGDWTIVVDGKDQTWPAGQRLDVAADGHAFTLVAPPAK